MISPPLTTSMTGTADDAVGFLLGLDVAPCALVLRPLLRQDQPAVLVLLLENEGFEALAERDDLVRIHVVADREFLRGDDALGLVADVEEYFVGVDLDDFAGDDLAFVELDDRLVDRFLERHAAQVVVDDLGLVELGFELAFRRSPLTDLGRSFGCGFRGRLRGGGLRCLGPFGDGRGRGGRFGLVVQHFVPYRDFRRQPPRPASSDRHVPV